MKYTLHILFIIALASACSRSSSVKSVQETPVVNAIASETKTTTGTSSTATLSFSEGSKYDFGTILTGLVVEKSVTLNNTGTGDATSLSAKTSSPFAFKGGTFPGTGGTCSTKLSAGAKCTIVLTYSSNNVASNSSSLSLTYVSGAENKTLSFSLSAVSSQFTQKQRIVATGTNARGSGDLFGRPISLNKDTLAVGAYLHDYDENGANTISDAGAAFIYIRSGTTWSLQQKIVAQGTNSRVSADRFGGAVAVYDDTLAVGAYLQDFDESGSNLASNAGAVYVYTRSNGIWTFQQKLVGQGTNGRVAADQFGWFVSLFDSTLAVSANVQNYDENGANQFSNAGAVYVFTRSNGTWTFQQKLVGQGTNSRAANDYFGISTSIFQNSIAIGANNTDYDENGANAIADGGTVFIFNRSGNTWSLQQRIVGQGTNGRVSADYFGTFVSLYEDTLAIGAHSQDYDDGGTNYVSDAGAVYVFVRSGGVWTQQQKIVPQGTNARVSSDAFGGMVSVYGDILAVSAWGQDYDENGANESTNAGAVYVFSRNNNIWTQQQKIVSQGVNSRSASDNFGSYATVYGNILAIPCFNQDYDENGANLVTNAGAVFMESL